MNSTDEMIIEELRQEVGELRDTVGDLREENERLRQQRDAANALVKLLEDALRNL